MKKILFVAAMFVAGSLSAKGFVENDNILVKEGVEKQDSATSYCLPVVYGLTCGETINDTHCFSPEPECDPYYIWALWNNEICGTNL